MGIVVQKFGGSSVADAQKMRACAEHVIQSVRAGEQVVVVVSAMGDSTDDLLKLVSSVSAKPNRRELDQVLATGELVSVGLVAMTLQAMGQKARSMTGAQAGIKTDEAFGSAGVLDIDDRALRELLREGVVPVVAGFQGVSGSGDVTTLGRGGSDTTAVALAAKLGGRCEILKDVDGVYTADPRVVPDARRLTTVTYDEMLEAAALGSQVIHPRAVELAKKFNVPLRVMHSHEPSRGGTLIVGEDGSSTGRVVSSVVLKRGVCRVSIRGLVNRPGIQSEVFEPLAAARVPIDDIIQEEDGPGTINLTFTLHKDDAAEASGVVHGVAGKIGVQAVRIDSGLATVSAVGSGMRYTPGVAARMFTALAGATVRIENISTSEIRISVVVAERDGARAAACIHEAFGLHVDSDCDGVAPEIKLGAGTARRAEV